jgi:hypothetical protein
VPTIRRLGSEGAFRPPEFVEASGVVALSAVPGLSVDVSGLYPVPEAD